jgi:hypothetical protein
LAQANAFAQALAQAFAPDAQRVRRLRRSPSILHFPYIRDACGVRGIRRKISLPIFGAKLNFRQKLANVVARAIRSKLRAGIRSKLRAAVPRGNIRPAAA